MNSPSFTLTLSSRRRRRIEGRVSLVERAVPIETDMLYRILSFDNRARAMP